MIKQNAQRGFTIVELLIATLVFSVILVIVATSVITFSRQFYKGRVVNNTQNVTRAAINEVSQAVQFSNGTVVASSNGTTNEYCINGKPYFFVIGKRLDDAVTATNAKAVLVTADDNCGITMPDIAHNGLTGLTNPRELLGRGMRLAKFTVVPSATLTKVEMTVAYGDDDLLCVPTGAASGCTHPTAVTSASEWGGSGVSCAAGSGNEYCGIVRLNSGVAKRLNTGG